MNRNYQINQSYQMNSRQNMNIGCPTDSRQIRNQNNHPDPHETMTQHQLLCHISEVSFAVDDILLYLDTHIHDEAARAYANEMIKMRNAASAVYARRFGPLTIDTAAERPCKNWEWAIQPWPWETPQNQRGGYR